MAPKSNRIEVDLQVMQNDAIAKLESFGKDFNNTVGRLGDLLESASGAFGGGVGQASGQLSDSASTVAGTERAMANVVQARTPGASPPITPGQTGGFESQMIDLQRRVMGDEAAIPSSLRQALGYYGAGQLNMNMFQPFSSSQRAADRETIGGPTSGQVSDQISAELASGALAPTPEAVDARTKEITGTLRHRNIANRANEAIFNYQATKALATNAMGKYTGFFGGIQGITNAGYQTSPSSGTGGILGSSLFSGSFWHGLGENVWQPLVSSTFGLNPAYSLGQAQAARQAINSYGWSSGNMGDYLANTLKQNTIRYQLDPQTQMAFLDPMLRWGGWQSFGQLNTVLGGISAAAQSAGMNLGQFTQELVQTSQQVAMATGNTPGVIAGEISSISATTGLSPEVAGQMESIQNIQLAAAYTGKNPWDIYTGKQNQAVLAPGMMRFQNLIGMPIDQFMKMKDSRNKAVRDAYKWKMWQATMMYGRDQSIFGGSSPLQLLHEITQAGSGKALLTQTHLQDKIRGLADGSMSPAHLDTTLEHILREYPGENEHQRNKIVQQYMSWARGHKGDTAQSRTNEALTLLGKNVASKRVQASRKIMIELSGDAKKYFQLQGDPGHTNSGGAAGFARSALNFVETDLNPANPSNYEPWKW